MINFMQHGLIISALVLAGFILVSPQDFRAVAQTPSPQISAENISRLGSAERLDFERLPADIHPASGQFAINANATRVVTFGNRPNDPPFSQAILWGYPQTDMAFNTIEGDSIARLLADDGLCLYTGYRGHYVIWRLDPQAASAKAWVRVSLPNPEDTAVNFWLADYTTCTAEVFVEVAAEDGQIYTLAGHETGYSILYPRLFDTAPDTVAARVGRIPPPLAVTVDFDGTLYRWDMQTNEITGQMWVGSVAMFGKLNASGSHYAWLSPDWTALQVVDFTSQTIVQTFQLEKTYISHLLFTHAADVIIGIDPSDARGTVRAWVVDNRTTQDLGAYRPCERTQPDLAQLSRDGSAVVIGCDWGVDIWRIIEQNEE
jgi:hypothetical protein